MILFTLSYALLQFIVKSVYTISCLNVRFTNVCIQIECFVLEHQIMLHHPKEFVERKMSSLWSTIRQYGMSKIFIYIDALELFLCTYKCNMMLSDIIHYSSTCFGSTSILYSFMCLKWYLLKLHRSSKVQWWSCNCMMCKSSLSSAGDWRQTCCAL